ncbi:hypothetical protein PoB_005422600 [Plakobranchus ocellatus]|uniref:Uncharacterized protein n=1 Tax=Plakobranchus ocellatus TaxID=259542 RepID=A0AAV4C8Q9_9GAST|nr:hypothetical protein PoB_005422600 [Plakobranchus ocellatus]
MGAMARLEGQLAIKLEVRGLNPSPGQVNFHCSSCPPSTKNGLLGLLRPGQRKGGEESNGKLPHTAVCQEQSGPCSWFPKVWTKRGTHFKS